MSPDPSTEGPRVLALGTDHVPVLAPSTVVLPGATVVGDVRLGERVGVWYAAVLRGDDAPVTVGDDTNLQDGVIVHADPGFPARIGARVTVGHGAVVHGATVDDDCLVGMRATLLNGARIGAGSLVAAGAVVLEGTEVPPGSLVAGVPAKVRRPVTDDERRRVDQGWRDYVDKAAWHASGAAAVPDTSRDSGAGPR